MASRSSLVNNALNRVGKYDQAEPDGTLTGQQIKYHTGASTAAYVNRILEEENVNLQQQGWYWNTEFNVEVSPDVSTKKIVMPVPASYAEGIGVSIAPGGEPYSAGSILTIDTDAADADKHVIRSYDGVSDKLFDVDNNVFTFETSIRVQYVWKAAIDQINGSFAEYLVARTAHHFARSWMRDRALANGLAMEAAEAEVRMRQEEFRQTDVNVLAGPEAVAIRGRRRRPTSREFYT